MIGVLSVIGGTAVVRDLEGDGGVSVAIGVSGWSEDEIADISDSTVAYPLPLALAAGANEIADISDNGLAVVDSVSVESGPLLTAFPSRVSEPAEAVVR